MSSRASTSSDSSSSSDSIRESSGERSGSATPGLEKAREDYFGDDEDENDPRYEPIRTFTASARERPDLASIASYLSRTTSRHTADIGSEKALERKDTLYGVEFGKSAVLDPTKPEFDFYKWVRFFTRVMEEEGIKHRRAGFTFRNVNVTGTGAALQLQSDVASTLLAPFRFRETLGSSKKTEKHILRDFNGCVRHGEMLIVLGKPGSGCTTFLKTISGETRGLNVSKDSVVHYNGIPQEIYKAEMRGDVCYNAETDQHFPHLTVGQTLEFAAAARAPSTRVYNVPRSGFVKHVAAVVMALYGLGHTYNTKVGNEYVRGVSGGERKRVSIAEMSLSGSPICCWDNSTRGLDAATALEFTRTLRISSKVSGMTHAVAIYQASQAIYDLFDKAMVLYEGRQIYFGPATAAREYFETMGWYCPPRQTTGDFLTSVTNPSERRTREGFESSVPRTPDEFERYWKNSQAFKDMSADTEQHEDEYPVGGSTLETFRESHHQAQAKHVRPKSPYTISILMQIRLCTVRAYQRTWNDKSSTISTVFGQLVLALIIGSIYYGTPAVTSAFFSKGAILFFAVLLNALKSITEINGLYAQRPIVERHVSFAFYHAFSEALAGIVSDIPIKFVIAVVFNIILYFLGGLRYEASNFFIFFLFTFVTMLTMSAMFRTLAAATKTISQALAAAGVMVLAIVIYTGFTIQRSYMHPWFKWLSWINPVAYAFEAILVNEVHGERFECANLVPPYGTGNNFECPVPGARPGERFVSGDDWAESAYGYRYSHLWRNLGFLFAFMIFFYFIYLAATEMNAQSSSSGEFLVFRRGHVPNYLQGSADEEHAAVEGAAATASESNDPANDEGVSAIPPQKDVFTWRDVVYDITIKGEPRRLLDHVSGWVKPGTLTALMGVSGAGKTTLLDALAQRTTTGVITGDMLVNGRPLDQSFQRKTGYVQQQDLHLETTTVREALRFSAMLRQPKTVSQKEKHDYVEEVIRMLHMEDFSEAIVGNPGEGLNVEQRKLLTIGVELAAKPALLLFLDEPTSGLDSQSSWGIVAFLRKLADNGQAVLATIHQPSAILFQEFDRLLFLAKGGKTVYFGDIGENSRTLLDYFESHGGRRCGAEENPAEYMLEAVGAGASGKSTQDWPTVWNESEEYKAIQAELDRIHEEKGQESVSQDVTATNEFSMPMTSQIYHVTYRVFQQYWRTPNYIWGKLLLCTLTSLFVGFSFYKQNSSSTGLQNALFAIFMMMTTFSTLVQQIMPRFITQRSLYEVRERPSKAYSWQAFLLANIIVEMPYQLFVGIIVWASLYFPVFGANQSSERQGLFLLYSMQFQIFTSTFAHMLIAGLPDAETAGNIATTMFSLILTFNGVLQPPDSLPGFWLFMWRVSPLTYTVGGLAATTIHGRAVQCADNELAVFNPPSNSTCADYLRPYFEGGAPGRLYNPDATLQCRYCPLTDGDQFLAASRVYWDQRWRNYGIGFAYIGFNIIAAVALYYIFRVRRSTGTTKRRMSLVVHYLGQAGYWVRRAWVPRHEEWCPKGKEHINDNLY